MNYLEKNMWSLLFWLCKKKSIFKLKCRREKKASSEVEGRGHDGD